MGGISTMIFTHTYTYTTNLVRSRSNVAGR